MHVQAQVIGFHQLSCHSLEMVHQIYHGLGVEFHQLKVQVRPFHQVLGEHAHSRAYFEHIPHGADRQGIHNPVCDAQIGEKMLSEGFLRSYFHRTTR